MSTDFDHYRGTKSGRITPATFTAPDGSKVFALGVEAMIIGKALFDGAITLPEAIETAG